MQLELLDRELLNLHEFGVITYNEELEAYTKEGIRKQKEVMLHLEILLTNS